MSTVEFATKKVKCRKQHKCTWCGERLQEGDDAFFRKKIHDGYFLSEHFHIECHDAMAKSDFGYENEFTPMEQLRGKTYEESHA